MRKTSMLVLLAAAVATGSLVWAKHHEGGHQPGDHEHSGWFDAPNCDICKPWAENPALMMGTKWESHALKNGMLMVSVAPEGQLEKFQQVCKKMDATIEKISAGQTPEHLCGFCESMGGLVQAGAKVEKVETKFGNITLVTADSPVTVKKIHEVTKRSQEEAKKMEAMMKTMKKAS